MGCAHCKKTVDAVNPKKLPPVVLSDKDLPVTHKDIKSLKNELEKHGVDLSQLIKLNLPEKGENNSSYQMSTPRTQSHLHNKDSSQRRLNNSVS